jgi:hypothetical protein
LNVSAARSSARRSGWWRSSWSYLSAHYAAVVRGGDVPLRLAGAGQKPYQALLIGITLAVVVGAPPGDMTTALWRSGDVIFGSLLAMLFTGIWPQRAFLHWRIQMASYVTAFNRLYQAGFSPNLVERPRLEKHMQKVLNDVVKMRGLITPPAKRRISRRPSLRRSRPSAVTWCACWSCKSTPTGRRVPATS